MFRYVYKIFRQILNYLPSVQFLQLLKILLDGKYDTLYCHEISSLANGSFAVYFYRKFSKKNQIKLIYDAHELEADRSPPRPHLYKHIVVMLENFYIRLGQVEVVTVSQSIATELTKRVGLPVNVVWNLPFDGDFKSGFEAKDGHDVKLDKNFLNCVMIGNLGPYRGVEQAINLLEIDKFVCLHFVGNDVNERYQTLLAEQGILQKYEGRVRFHGVISADSLVQYISKFDVCVLPIQPNSRSYQYCAPNKFFEAAFSNIPIMYQYDGKDVSLTEIDSLAEYVTDCFRCDFNNKKSVAEVLQSVRTRVGTVSRDNLEYFKEWNMNYFKSLVGLHD